MKKLQIIIPALNEEKSISRVLKAIPERIEGIDRIQTLVIDDGSVDATSRIAREHGAEVIRHEKNKGLGVTFRRGIHAALVRGADIIVNIDADGQFDPEDIPKLVAPVLNGTAEFVTASRFLDRHPDFKISLVKLLGNKGMSWFISRIIKQRYFDVSCGFRAYSREAAMRLNLFGSFTYTQETFIDLASKGVSILEVPIKVLPSRKHGRSRISSNLFRYGFHTMKIILTSFRDYRPLGLMSVLSGFCAFIGLAVGVFFISHYIRAGQFRPHTWAAFLSGAGLILSLFFLIVGVLMEMFSRMRMNQEKLLFYARKEYYRRLGEKDGE